MGEHRAGVLLVHGAWFAAGCWDGVAARLRRSGIDVAVAALHRGSLAADTAAAREALETLEGPAVVCGHSYGGAVITGLPTERISHLVYLAATMLAEDETPLALIRNGSGGLEGAMRPTATEGTTVLDPAVAGPVLAAQLGPDARAQLLSGLSPQNMAAGFESPRSVAWRTRPSTYVVCTEDRAIPPEEQRRLARRATSTREWRSDHAAFASHESETVALLTELARPAG